jgi:hypothetical protein
MMDAGNAVGHMTRRPAIHALVAALLLVASLSAGALDIEGTFQLGNMGFTPTRASTDATYAGADYFADGNLSLRQDLPGGIRIEAAAQRDVITGNAVWAILQYKTDYFRVALGPYIGLAGSVPNILKPGISALLGAQLPGIAFLTLRTDIAQGGQAADTYAAQNSAISLGFYVRDSAICSFGVSYDQLSSVPSGTEQVDSLTAYTFDVEVFEKNVAYRLDFNFAYEVLLRQYLDGAANPEHGLDSVVAGVGVDVLITPSVVLLLGFRTSVWTLGTGVLSSLSDIGFAPFLFQASAGLRVTLGDAPDSAGL